MKVDYGEKVISTGITVNSRKVLLLINCDIVLMVNKMSHIWYKNYFIIRLAEKTAS